MRNMPSFIKNNIYTIHFFIAKCVKLRNYVSGNIWGGVMKKIFWIAILAIFGCVTIGWYYYSPYLALSGLRDAIIEADAGKIEKYVDFKSVRSHLKTDVMAAMEEQGKEADSPFSGEAGEIMASAMVGAFIDRVATPEGLAKLLRHAKQQQDSDTGGEQNPGFDSDEFDIERVTFNSFFLKKKNDESEMRIEFTRDGLSWKLSRILMPDPAENQ